MAETTNTQLPPVTDIHSAAKHIEGLLDLGLMDETDDIPEDDAADYEDTEESNDSEDAAPEETPASEDDESATEQETPAIEPPQSWNAEAKERFSELPPELQQYVSQREGERDKVISQKLSQVAEQRKAIEAEASRATQVQAQYAQTLNQLLTLTVPELQEIERTDWRKLADENPQEYVRLSAVRDDLGRRVNFMTQQANIAQQQMQQQNLAMYQARVADQYNKLIEEVPDFGEPEKAQAIVTDISKTMHGYGFTPEEINGVADARVVKVMARLATLEKAEAARKSAQGKKNTPAPKFMKPSAKPVNEDTQSRKMSEQWDRLKKTGNARDAAKLIEHLI